MRDSSETLPAKSSRRISRGSLTRDFSSQLKTAASKVIIICGVPLNPWTEFITTKKDEVQDEAE